jgi:hypothetical protein
MKKIAGLMLLLATIGARAQLTSDFNCPSFNGSGSPTACSAAQAGNNGVFQIRGGGNLSGSIVNLVPANSGHNGYNVNYAGPSWTSTTTGLINVQAFQTTWTFVPNGQNLALTIQNTTNQPGSQGNIFTTGAGCEASFFQGSVALPYYYTPDHVFALLFTAQNWTTWSGGSGSFTGSNFQIYQSIQNPCLPSQGSDHFAYMPINMISTSPVTLINPSGTCPDDQTCPNGQFTTTGDLYSVSVGYDGYTLSMCMTNVTLANGTCSTDGTSGTGTYVQQSWTGVYIPEIVGATTAYVGLGSGVNIAELPNLNVNSWSYGHLAPTGSPSYTAWNANSTYSTFGPASVASPVYSVAPGTYSGTQSVSITESTTPNTYVCYVLSSTTPTLYPQPDNGVSFIGGPQANEADGWLASTALVAGQEVIVSNVWYKWSGGTTGATEPTWPGSGSVSDGSGTWTEDPNGGCAVGTRYVSPISISSTATLYAMAGSNTPLFSNADTLPAGLGPPSSLVAGTYTISGGSASSPKISGNAKFSGKVVLK